MNNNTTSQAGFGLNGRKRARSGSPICSAAPSLTGKKIVTHPDNVPLLESWATKMQFDRDQLAWGVPVVTNKHMDKDRPTGRIVTPDGVVCDREGWTWQWDRFTTLEESDLPWAIGLGLVREETEPLFYIMDDFKLFTRFDMPLIREPSFVIRNATL